MSTTQTSTTNAHGSQVRIRPDLSVEDVLHDYKIHHSSHQPLSSDDQQSSDRNIVIVAGGIPREAQPSDFDSSLAPHPTVPYPVSNPGWWTDTFRRVPDFRPINQHLDLNERRQMLLFTIVGGIMVRGCWLMSVWAQAWRNTAGRVTDIGLSKVGGEW
ncbi:hypothetical protein FBEOM_6776 [Fusarium beomiforme]|uniref:Uncharacterized protein n=1 Tax=Fusarium beomiforme TaxID=44412 RepID=A0A9P5AIK2_9HYPO|nr:hypothetical protein FBEOM_6776 [Fusarium beomiforme]